MKIKTADFILSAPTLADCPDFGLPEIAMIGRSNVGKSSFINAILGRKKIAKTSNTPGKTRLINLYKINEEFVIADLPGYGYARVSKMEQKKWQKNLQEYLLKRDTLRAVIQLIDIRHDAQKNDLQMREWLEHYKIPIVTFATKADTISKNDMYKSKQKIARTLNTEVIEFSAKSRLNTDQALDIIEEIVK